MRLALRIGALAIAVAGLIDPVIARRVAQPVSITFQLPRSSDPGYERLVELRARIQAMLDESIVVDGPMEPAAIVAIGNAEPGRSAAPVFVLAPDVVPAVSIEGVSVPRSLVTGQAATVRTVLRATKLSGQKSTAVLELEGVQLGSVEHEWTSDDERFEHAFTVVVPRAGVQRVRVKVTTDGIGETAADAVLVVRDRPLRVLVYEPRPSWAVTFVRRSLEADAMFSLAATSRSSRPAATRSGDAPVALGALDADVFDVLVVGGLDELTEADWRAAERFVATRGGTLLLLPDRQVPDHVRRRLSLPPADEVLLENPVTAEGESGIQASELLLIRPGDAGFRTLASVRQGGQSRPIVVATPMGEGTVVLSGALDAWRYREGGRFDGFWRGIVADAALTAVPRIDVSITPNVTRPGEPVSIRARVRETEFARNASERSVGPVEAALVREDGTRETIRIWPGSRPGIFEGTFRSSMPGRHVVEVALGSTRTGVPLLVALDVVHPARDARAEWRYAAAASGGAVVRTPEELLNALSRIETGSMEQVTRPMRSPWWIVPFAGLLSAEWLLRRRAGQK